MLLLSFLSICINWLKLVELQICGLDFRPLGLALGDCGSICGGTLRYRDQRGIGALYLLFLEHGGVCWTRCGDDINCEVGYAGSMAHVMIPIICTCLQNLLTIGHCLMGYVAFMEVKDLGVSETTYH